MVRITLVILVLLGATSAYAEKIRHDRCQTDFRGQTVCPPPGGEIHVDVRGQFVCGNGQCAEDARFQLVCASERGGYVVSDFMGVKCSGGCQPASAGLCQIPR